MKRFPLLAALLVPCSLLAAGGLDLIVTRYAAAASETCAIAQAKVWRGTLKDDGSWADIDYRSQQRSGWTAGHHLSDRVRALAADWFVNRDRASLEAAHRALGFWTRHRLTNPNWWWNVIGVPRAIGDAALMMDSELSDAERTAVVEIMSPPDCPWGKTGQNFAWTSEIRLRRALLTRDEAGARAALADVLREVRIGEKEGIRSDWCFHQHGAQPQFGNYGLSFLNDQARLAALLAGTDLPYPPEKLALVESLASEGYSWICWKGAMDVSAMGRQIEKNAQFVKAAGVARAFANLEKAGWRRPAPRVGFRYFDKSAYAVWRTDGWMASVRASTPSIIGVETWINEDNAKGMCMADGALMTYVTGREYENVFPLWDDWRMVPGVTGYLGKPVARTDARNARDDIRALSRDAGGEFEFTFEREGLVAHKKWTFGPDGIVCEGSGISASDAGWEVATCVEHALAAPDAGVVYSRDGESRFRNGPIVYTVCAPKEAIRFELAERTGDYSSYMLSAKSETRTGRVFSLRILHGRAPKDAAYAYRISFDGKDSDRK